MLRRTVPTTTAGTWSTSFVPNDDTNVIVLDGSSRSTTKAIRLAPIVTAPTPGVVRKGSVYVLRGRAVPGTAVYLRFRTSADPVGVFPIRSVVTAAADGTWSRPVGANRSYQLYVSRTTTAPRTKTYVYVAR